MRRGEEGSRRADLLDLLDHFVEALGLERREERVDDVAGVGSKDALLLDLAVEDELDSDTAGAADRDGHERGAVAAGRRAVLEERGRANLLRT